MTNLDRPMEETDDLDPRARVASLCRRIQELERENERLRSQLSICSCSKEKDARSCTSEFVGVNGTSKGGSQGNAFLETTELAKSFPPDIPLTSPSALAEEPFDYLHLEKSAKFSKLRLKDQPGCQPSTMQVCAKRYVALKVMYFGKRFYGFASEAQMDPTIESEVFKALERTKLLVGSRTESKYSRCGRTDKGVSSSGQVLSLYLRSNLKDAEGNIKKQEIDYVKVLNRVLPSDIRVVGWCPVSTDFSARFSCLSREYRYLFWRGALDIAAMRKAAEKLIGEHDFRNFCKMDAANVKNYKRKITKFDISPCNQRFDVDELWAITVKGSAFLWHQVRCMVSVLFMIGQGLESPDVVDVLLDIEMTPRKPQYTMATELPLILQFCEFKDVNFICSSESRRALHEHLTNELRTYMLQAAIYHETLSCLSTPEEGPSEPGKKKRGHVPLILRPTEPSFDERRAKLDMRTIYDS
ncbi:tRNA pseudouridine(38/39) synthase isoform X2 [Asparagus officinalis]|nr:tRNA pseudouridine(38/39) synthase isoform X2 [Asparagus officinalis]